MILSNWSEKVRMLSGSKKLGVILSYLTVVCNMISNLLLVPFYLRTLGVDAYGFFQYVYSLAQYAMILDFGIATIVTKYLSLYRVNGSTRDEVNFLGHVRIIVLISIIIITVVGGICYHNLNGLIINRTEKEMALAKTMLWLMIGLFAIAIIQHYYDGILLAYEEYVISRGINVVRIITKIVFILLFVTTSNSIIGIVTGDICSSIFCLIGSMIIAKRKTKYKARLYTFDKRLFKEAMILALALMLQSIVTYANNALDKYIVGSFFNNSAVTIYTMALLIYEVFVEMSISVNSVFLPQVTKTIVSGGNSENITDVVIKVGRLQCILCMAMLFGFGLFGKQFLILWTHSDIGEAWIMAMILMLGQVVHLCESTCLSVLVIKNKRMFRSILLFAIAICNIVLSIILLKIIGIIGVAIGTMLSVFVGDVIVMNIYYKTKLHINVGRIFKSVYPQIVLVALVTTLLLLPVRLFLERTAFSFFFGIVAFCIIYVVLLYLFALNDQEKELINTIKNRIIHIK